MRWSREACVVADPYRCRAREVATGRAAASAPSPSLRPPSLPGAAGTAPATLGVCQAASWATNQRPSARARAVFAGDAEHPGGLEIDGDRHGVEGGDDERGLRSPGGPASLPATWTDAGRSSTPTRRTRASGSCSRRSHSRRPGPSTAAAVAAGSGHRARSAGRSSAAAASTAARAASEPGLVALAVAAGLGRAPPALGQGVRQHQQRAQGDEGQGGDLAGDGVEETADGQRGERLHPGKGIRLLFHRRATATAPWADGAGLQPGRAIELQRPVVAGVDVGVGGRGRTDLEDRRADLDGGAGRRPASGPSMRRPSTQVPLAEPRSSMTQPDVARPSWPPDQAGVQAGHRGVVQADVRGGVPTDCHGFTGR